MRIHQSGYAELALAIASLAAGASFSALSSGVGLRSPLGWLFYCVFPPLATATAVAHWFLRRVDSELVKAAQLLSGEWRFESITKTSGKKTSGFLTFDVTPSRISAAGPIYGEKRLPIGEVTSELCYFDSRSRRLVVVYHYSAQDDNGRQLAHLCILTAFVLDDPESNGWLIKGFWHHMDWDGGSNRPCGEIEFMRSTSPVSKRTAA
jgi:hypothetical protein